MPVAAATLGTSGGAKETPSLDKAIGGDTLESWRLLARHPDWAGGLRSAWVPGEAARSGSSTHS